MRVTRATAIAVCAAVLMLMLSALAGAQAQTASQFYLEYRKAFDAAKKVEDLFPFMAKATIDMVQATPAAERPGMFEMIKEMGALTDVKIVKEARTDSGATLTVEALDTDKKKTTGTITVVREGAAWKLGRESWSS
jgi:hypothetical protein